MERNDEISVLCICLNDKRLTEKELHHDYMTKQSPICPPTQECVDTHHTNPGFRIAHDHTSQQVNPPLSYLTSLSINLLVHWTLKFYLPHVIRTW